MAVGYKTSDGLLITTYHFHNGHWEIALPDFNSGEVSVEDIPSRLLDRLQQTFKLILKSLGPTGS